MIFFSDNLENSLNQTTVTRSTRLKQQKLLESLATNENETSENDSEEFYYFDEFLEDNSNSQLDRQVDDQNNDKSIYESAESESNSIDSNFEDTNNDTEYDNQSNSSDKSYNEFLSLESDQESLDEDLELKRKELEREAKRLIRKKEKLSSKILNSDCMISNSDSFGEPIRKSLRKRTLSKKFTDDDYSFNEEEIVAATDDDQYKHEVSLDGHKGELKLKIKRVTNASNLNRINCTEAVIDELPSKRKRNNSGNYKSSLNNSPLNLFPELSMPICSPEVSPSAVSPAKVVVKSNSSPPVPPPPLALPVPPHNIFNDDEDEDLAKKDLSSCLETDVPDNVKTLARIKSQIAEKKRKLSDEINSNFKRSKSIDSNLSIQKIVTELKSIGSNSNEYLSSSASTPEQKSNAVDDEATLDISQLPTFLLNIDLVDLIKSQQDKEKKLSHSRQNSITVDTNFLAESLQNSDNSCNELSSLPNINTLILKTSQPVNQKSKESHFPNQFVTPLPVHQYPQTPNRVIQPVVYQNGYQTNTRPSFVTSSPNYNQKQQQAHNHFQYPRYPSQAPAQPGQFMPPHQSQLHVSAQIAQAPSLPSQHPSQQIPIQHHQIQHLQQQQQHQQQQQQQILSQQQIPKQLNQQYTNYAQFGNQQAMQQSQSYQQNVVLVQSPIKQGQPSSQVYAPPVNQLPMQTNIKPVQQGINVSIPQQQQQQQHQQQQQQQQQQQSINSSQNLVNSLISPISSQNSQSSPNVHSVTPTKTKRKEKDKSLNVSTGSASCQTASQPSSSNPVNCQNQSQNSQSRSARSTQHQLTVAQLLSQKHQQQQQQQQQKSQESNPRMTSPLTIPNVIQVNEQSNSNSSIGSQIIIPASLTSNSQNNSQFIKLFSDSESKNGSNIQQNCLNSNGQFSSPQANISSSLSIPTPLSQSTKILLNDSSSTSPQTVACIPVSNLNMNSAVGQPNQLLADPVPEADKFDMPCQSHSNDKHHECLSKKAMVECEKCMLFCHDDCVYLKKADSARPQAMRLCATCFNEEEKKLDAN